MQVLIREPVKNYLAENHFSKKPLAEMGGTPPTPLTEYPLTLLLGAIVLIGMKYEL